MDMSPAALPPPAPRISPADRRHPLFPVYEQHRRSCVTLLIQCADFQDWLAVRAHQAVRDHAAEHPRYDEFVAWMQANQGGARRCPAGDFPNNFNFWLDGGRW